MRGLLAMAVLLLMHCASVERPSTSGAAIAAAIGEPGAKSWYAIEGYSFYRQED
jgi:hypothetical protein